MGVVTGVVIGLQWDINNSILLTWGTTVGTSQNTFPIAYQQYVLVFCSICDVGNNLICGVSIDWKTTSQFFVTLAYTGNTFKFVTYWVSIGY